MQTRKTIEKRLQTLIQAYGFSHAHRGELSEEARVKLRALEENIGLLQWCLEEPEPQAVTWQTVREATAAAWGLLRQKLFGRSGKAGPEPRPDTARPSLSTSREVIR